MCLDILHDKQTRKRTGYKVMYNLKGCVSSYIYRAELPKGKWTKDGRRMSIGSVTNPSFSYPPGFHIWLRLEDARRYGANAAIIKVKFKDVVATGRQSPYGDVAVAREIYIPKRIKDYRHD